jgi:chromosome segregation ATPase
MAVTLNKTPLTERRKALVTEQGQVDASLDPKQPNSFFHKKAEIEDAIRKLQDELDEPNRRYQAYETALKAWDTQRLAIIGSKDGLDTVAYYEAQLKDLDEIPDQLQKACARRLNKAKEIHEVIRELADTYREVYTPVNSFIETRALARDKFHLNFEVSDLAPAKRIP